MDGQQKQSCESCVHYKRTDMRAFLDDPDAIFMLCSWSPMQPEWMPVPAFSVFPFNGMSQRKPTDGANCQCYEPRSA